jgi:hypothetical protein
MDNIDTLANIGHTRHRMNTNKLNKNHNTEN